MVWLFPTSKNFIFEDGADLLAAASCAEYQVINGKTKVDMKNPWFQGNWSTVVDVHISLNLPTGKTLEFGIRDI
jgi:hypothetical protein